MIIPVGYGQANIRFSGQSAPNGAEVTFGFDHAGYGGDATLAASNIWGAASGNLMEHLCNTVQIDEVYVKFGPNSTGASGIYAAVSLGGLAQTSVPPNVSALVRKATALGGRAGRGRLYLPGVPEAQVTAQGSLESTYLADLQSDVDAFFAAVATAGLTPVVLHGPGSPITIPTEITSTVVDGRVATQRRRLRP